MAAKRVNESGVWSHMEKAGDGKAKCKLCSRLFACTGSSTSGLKHHLESMHAGIMAGVKPKASQAALSSFGIGVKRQCTESRQEKLTALLAKVIVVNMLPLSLVYNAEFKQFLAAMEPEYRLVK